VRRILAKVRPQGFNSLEVTGIVAKHLLGVRYATVSAHSRHIQPSCYLDGFEIRRASQLDADWANG
jgi:isochorismate hydrolase